MKRYLVTGGLGFLGAALTRGLVAAGHRVRVFDNASRGSLERLGDTAADVEVMTGDIRDPDAVRRAIRDTDVVCHLAFVNGTEFFYRHPAYVLDVGVKGMVNVLDACIALSVPELVLASSSEVYQTPPAVPTDESVPLTVPDPGNPRYSYGGGKIISELMALNYGREYFERVVVFRPHNVYGPAMGWEHVIPQFVRRMVDMAARNGSDAVPFPIQGDGSQTRSFIYIDDFTDGLLRVIEAGEHLGIYHIGTTEEVTIRDVADAVAACLGMRIAIQAGPEAVGGTPRRCPDVSRLAALGFTPRFTLATGLPPTVSWYAAHEPPANGAIAPRLYIGGAD